MRLALICLAFLFSFNLVSATIDYTTLAPIEGFVGDNGGVEKVGESTLDGYLNNMFRLGIALCTGLAVLMIVIGGIQYVSSDAWSKKSDGKERIIAAVFGLLIALGSWALLNTIDPRLMSTKLTLENIKLADIKVTPVNVIVDADGTVTNGTTVSKLVPGDGACNQPLANPDGGLVRSQSGAALDSDGSNTSPGDSTSQNQTSYVKASGQHLDAQRDYYVAVPNNLTINGKPIVNGTRVLITNTVDGLSVWGIVGDRNGNSRGEAGEMSTAATKALGIYESDNSVKYSNRPGAITFTYFPDAANASEIGC